VGEVAQVMWVPVVVILLLILGALALLWHEARQ
jgi:hypothetical protein